MRALTLLLTALFEGLRALGRSRSDLASRPGTSAG
jgi:hypothetical protein